MTEVGKRDIVLTMTGGVKFTVSNMESADAMKLAEAVQKCWNNEPVQPTMIVSESEKVIYLRVDQVIAVEVSDEGTSLIPWMEIG